MFNVFSQTGVPGFRVRPEDDVPGFDIDENGLPRRDRPWPDGMGPGSTTPQYPDLARAMMATPGPEGLVQPAPPQPPDWLYKLLTMSLPASAGAFAPLSGPRPAPYGTPINPVSFYPTTDQNMRQMGDASGGSRTGQWPSFDAPKPPADIETRDGAATARNAYPPPAGQEAMGDAWPQPLEDGRTYAQAGAAGPQDLSGAEMALPRREGPWSDGAPTGISTPQAVTPVNCTTVNGSLDCTSPGGVSFSGGVKASPGFPERLDSTTEDKHAYSVPDGPYQDSTRTMRQDVINYPTPGPTKLVRPATPEGTLNEATPEWIYNLLTTPLPMGPLGWRPIVPYGKMINPVRSYLTTDQNGRQIVVNVTEPGHMLHPGYVVRYVTPSDGGATIQNEGEGSGNWQGSLSQRTPLAGLISSAWEGLYRKHLNRPQ